VNCDIETHFHNDTGCAIANAYCALEAGATHVDTSVLGIGERNGITPLGGLMARMIVADHDYVSKRYNLQKLKEVEELVAEAVQVNIPFNNPITGFCAFTHKAGIHAKAILNNPSTYEIIDPSDFGLSRYVHFASRLTGWNAIKSRAEQLKLSMTEAQYKECTAKVKALADLRVLTLDDADSVIRNFHRDLNHPPTPDGILNGALAEPSTLNGEGKEPNKTNGTQAEPSALSGDKNESTKMNGEIAEASALDGGNTEASNPGE
jgi:homocitrate synthase